MEILELIPDLERYRQAPVLDERALPSFLSLASEIDKQYYALLRTGLKVFFVNYDPYKDLEELTKDVNRGLLKISQLFNVHPLLTKDENLRLRAIHDFAHYSVQADFDLQGEYRTFLEQAATSRVASIPALFTEIVLQAAHRLHYGDFPIQKIFIAERYVC